MTDEIKMCVAYEPQGVFIEWVPLDPQPSCETCRNIIEREFCHRVGIMPAPDFYCKHWEMKK